MAVVRAAGVALAVALLGLAACDPDIGSGTYYCGPERACPEDLRCDEATARCVFPQLVDVFDCGPDGNVNEPDDAAGEAHDVGTIGCDRLESVQVGCVDNAGDVDYLRGVTPAGCAGDVTIELFAPVAFMPLSIQLLDEGGAVLATGAVCTEVDDDGEQRVCVSAEVGAATPYLVRIQRADGGDCGGACAYNRYHLTMY